MYDYSRKTTLNMFTCKRCGIVFDRKGNLQRHINKKFK